MTYSGDHDMGWFARLRGRFVVFDGPDGSGKSTQFRRFSKAATLAGLQVCEVREPGGTDIGEAIRRVLLDPDLSRFPMDTRCEMLLYMASRSQLVAERIEPALGRGELVMADRFISSTLAYQGAAGGLPIADILRAGQIALGNAWPDLVVVFDVDQQTAAQRMNPLLRGQEFDKDLDRIEMRSASYHQRVRQGYLDQAQQDPERYAVLDARGDEQAVYRQLIAALQQRCEQWSQVK